MSTCRIPSQPSESTIISDWNPHDSDGQSSWEVSSNRGVFCATLIWEAVLDGSSVAQRETTIEKAEKQAGCIANTQIQDWFLVMIRHHLVSKPGSCVTRLCTFSEGLRPSQKDPLKNSNLGHIWTGHKRGTDLSHLIRLYLIRLVRRKIVLFLTLNSTTHLIRLPRAPQANFLRK